jgi:phosphonate degradation associated HDIG domain protein
MIMEKDRPMLDIDRLIDLLADKGGAQYGGEAVSQREHALQSAWLGEKAGASASLIAASLLHDVGHLLHQLGDNPAEHGVYDRHEAIAGKQLRALFGAAVAEPIRLHVDAKLWLCATDPGYAATLSPASVRSLALQGGPFAPAEADAFIAAPFAADAVRLRRWDDDAKIAGLETPPLAHFRRYLADAKAAAAG